MDRKGADSQADPPSAPLLRALLLLLLFHPSAPLAAPQLNFDSHSSFSHLLSHTAAQHRPFVERAAQTVSGLF